MRVRRRAVQVVGAAPTLRSGHVPSRCTSTTPSEAEGLVDALLSAGPAAAVALLRLRDPSLQEAVAVARRRLAAPSPDALALLRAVARFPGSRLAELGERVQVQDLQAAARELVDKALVDPARFGRTDCWARTAAGAALLRDSEAPPSGRAT